MGSRTFIRRRAAVAVTLAAVAAGALVAVPARPAGAVEGDSGAGEVVLPAADRTAPRDAGFRGFGDTGLVTQPERTAHVRWTDYATGRSRELTEFPEWDGTQGTYGLAQSDTVFKLSTDAEGRKVVEFRALGSGADEGRVTVPSGMTYAGTAGPGTVVAYVGSPSDVRELHLLKAADDGGTSDTKVTGWPEGGWIQAVSEGDARSLLLRYRMRVGDPAVVQDQLVLVDVHDGSWVEVLDPYKAAVGRNPVLSRDYVGWWYPGQGAQLLRRDDLDGPVITVPAQGTEGKSLFRIVGDDVVVADISGSDDHPVLTRPLTDAGEWRELFPHMGGWIYPTPDGSAVVAAGSGAADWGVQRLSEGADGQIVARELVELPPAPARVDGVALTNGTLAWADDTAFKTRTVSGGAVPQVGPVREAGDVFDPCAGVCVQLHGTGDGAVVLPHVDAMAHVVVRQTAAGETQAVGVPGFTGKVEGAYGRYAVVLRAGGGQSVVDWTQRKVVAKFDAAAATVWDGQLWATTTKAGHLTTSRLGTDLPAVDVNVGSGCVPSELQVNGRFVYWACASQGKAGVFDRSRGRSVSVPSGDAVLANGFLVRHDTVRGKLVRTDVASGKALTADLADLPATADLDTAYAESDRGVRWNLDPYGDHVVFADADERLHLLTAGTVAGPVRRDHAGRDGVADLLTLNSAGALTFQQGTGRGTFSGKVSGSGWSTSVRAVPFGDLSGDGCNDVLIRLSSGALRLYKPSCGGALKPTTSYTTLGTSGWNQYDVLTAPGDVTKDGLPDLLARNARTGAVYLYKGTSSGRLSARVKLYDNWKTYKKVVGAGDLNGDGIGDLVAQDKANNLYRYYGKGNGTFSARVKLFSGWGSSYNAVVGVGDITGDGKADLVARDTAGVLYRLPGNGKGSFGGRVKISGGWQGYKGIF
ncbi:FG-GAP repeat domain-containing protein [Streptomyces sp. NPDC096132]|uniref:FG-GAP repeat domain-containing protein n=1 Tax=Streptomyces sp. NPDC096132 TaxID=3366075 RepID=UPI0037FE7BA3